MLPKKSFRCTVSRDKQEDSRPTSKTKGGLRHNKAIAREFNVVDMFFTADFRGTGSRWVPGFVIKITVPLFYFVELATSKTVCHQVDNVKKRPTCWILMKLHRLVFSHLQMLIYL